MRLYRLMIEVKTKVKRWGNSLAVVLPQSAIHQEHVVEGDEVSLLVQKKDSSILKKSFGTFKFKEPIEKIMQEVDEAYGK